MSKWKKPLDAMKNCSGGAEAAQVELVENEEFVRNTTELQQKLKLHARKVLQKAICSKEPALDKKPTFSYLFTS